MVSYRGVSYKRELHVPLLVDLVFECTPKSWGFLRILKKTLKVRGEDEDSIFEIEDQILRIIEVWEFRGEDEVKDFEVFGRSNIDSRMSIPNKAYATLTLSYFCCCYWVEGGGKAEAQKALFCYYFILVHICGISIMTNQGMNQ